MDLNQGSCGTTAETYRRTLSQLVSSYHLDIEVFGLRLASRLDEPLQHLKANKEQRGHGHVVSDNYKVSPVYVGFKLYQIKVLKGKRSPIQRSVV